MKLKFLASAILTTVLLIPAHAGTDMKDMKEMVTTPELRPVGGAYVAVYGGAQFYTGYGNQRQTFTSPTGTTIIPSSSFDSGWGGAGGIKFGYNFAGVPVTDSVSIVPALELEALYLGGTSKGSMSGSVLGSGTTRTSYNSAAWFGNAILRVKNPSIVTPYIGVGPGGQYLTIHSDDTVAGVRGTGVTGGNLDFAGQALAGFDIAVDPHFTVFTEYKFIDAIGTDIKVSNFGGTGFGYRFKPDQIQQSLLVAGLQYNF